MYYLADFARTIGSKDKQKRKSNLIRNIAIGTTAATVIGVGGKILLKNKNKVKNTPKPIRTTGRRFPKSTSEDVARRQANIKTDLDMNDAVVKEFNSEEEFNKYLKNNKVRSSVIRGIAKNREIIEGSSYSTNSLFLADFSRGNK